MHAWNQPSKHLLVLRTSSTRLQRDNFTSSKTSWRRLEGVFKTSCKEVLKTSWGPLARRLEDVLEDEKLLRWRRLQDVLSWRRLEDMSGRRLEGISWTRPSWRRLGGKQNFYWWYMYLTNLNAYLTTPCFTNLYLTNLRRIQNASLRIQ